MRLKLLLIGFGALFLLLAGMRPDTMPYSNAQARYSDSITAHWPNALFLRDSILERHEFPVWRDTILAGQPFAANPLNKTAYPLQWFAVIFPPTLHLNIMIVIHLLIAGSGMWQWVKSLGLRQEAIILSAAAYTFAPQLIGRTGAGHFDMLYALAWWPWLMWTVKRSADQPKWMAFLQIGVVAALLFLADTRTSLFAFLTAGIYGVYCFYQSNSLREVYKSLTSLPVFVLLTLSLLIPLFLWQPYLTRASLTPQDAGTYSLEPIQLVSLMLPAQQNVETQIYLGLPVLALTVLGILAATRRRKIIAFIVFVIITLYSLGLNGFLWPIIVRIIPTLLWFRVPTKAWLILTLFVPLLAGYGLQWLLNTIENGAVIPYLKRLNLLVAVSTLIAILVALFGVVVLKVASGAGVIISLALGGILIAALNKRLGAQRVFILILIFTLLDLGIVGYQSAQWRGTDMWLDPYRPLAERLTAENPDTIYSPTYSLEPQVAEVYHLRLFGGVDPFQLAGIVDAVSQGSGIPHTQYNPVVPPLEGIEDEADAAQANPNAIIHTDILAQWHVSHVVSGHALENDRLELVDTVNGVYIYKNLDYVARSFPTTIPDWPAAWPGLPDQATVQQFNQTTILMTFISGIGWIIVLGWFILLRIRHR